MSSSAIRAGRAFVELFADDSMLVRTLRRTETRVVQFGNNIKSIGKKIFALGAVAALPFGLSMKTFADFDDQMRAVKAVTGATGKEFEDLTEKAKFLGRTTSFTASQVASAMLELGRAGFAPKEIDAAIPSVLNLARATGTELATSAEICSNTLRAFELPAEQMTRVCDVMVAAANNSAQTLEDLGESMTYCSPIASEYGLTLEQTAKALGSLANYGIKGSQAGTTLRRILTNLADPIRQKQLGGLGVDVVDTDTGKLREVSDILRDLGKATQQMPKDQKLGLFKDIFGLYAIAGGAKLTVTQFDKLIESVDNAAGTGSRAAKEMDAGIGGSLRMLWSAVEGVAIATGEALSPSLKRMTDYFTAAASGVADYLTQHKEIVVSAAKTIAGITGIGAALLTTGFIIIGFGKTIGAVATVITTFANIALGGLSLIGGAFSALSAVAGGIVSVIYSAVAGLGVVFGGVAAVFSAAFSVIAAAGTAVFAALGTIIAALVSPIGLVIVSLAAVGGICYIVYRNFTAIGNAASAVFANIVSVIRRTLNSVYEFFNSFTEFKIIFTSVRVVSTLLRTLGQTFLAAGTNVILPVVQLIVQGFQLAGQTVIRVGANIISDVVSVFAMVGNAVVSAFSGLTASIRSVFSGIISVIGGVFARIGKVFAPVYAVVNAVFVRAAEVIGGFTAVLRNLSGYIVSFARSFFVIESGIQVFSLLSRAVSGIAGVFAGASRGIISVFVTAFQNIPVLLTGFIQYFTAVPGQIISAFNRIPSIIASIFSSAVGIVKTVVFGIGSVLSGLITIVRNIGNVLSGTFSAAFNFIGGLIQGFGNFFLGAFTSIGTAVDWLREQFSSLCSFAAQTYGAVVSAFGRGDIESAVQVIWASIKLIWVKGSTSLLTTWYWLTDTLQTAWATAVFKISELLTTAWFGVQEFWTETVYTMSTLWVEFSNGVASTWKKAEQSIAQGIGYIIAKMQGLDPNEMSGIINEDYQRQTQQRESDKSKQLTAIQTQRDKKMSSLSADKQGTLNNLQSDFQQNAATRQSSYGTKIAAQESELTAAKNAYSEAINRAKNPPAPKQEETPSLTDRLKAKAEEVVGGFNAKRDMNSSISVSGSFSAAAIQSMGFGTSMDRVAKATEKSEKHLEKLAGKNDKKEKATVKKEEETKDGEDLAVKELKQQTRYLRDISERGIKFV